MAYVVRNCAVIGDVSMGHAAVRCMGVGCCVHILWDRHRIKVFCCSFHILCHLT